MRYMVLPAHSDETQALINGLLQSNQISQNFRVKRKNTLPSAFNYFFCHFYKKKNGAYLVRSHDLRNICDAESLLALIRLRVQLIDTHRKMFF